MRISEVFLRVSFSAVAYIQVDMLRIHHSVGKICIYSYFCGRINFNRCIAMRKMLQTKAGATFCMDCQEFTYAVRKDVVEIVYKVAL